MNPDELAKLKHLALLKRQFEKGMRDALPHVFARFEEEHFLLMRFHRNVPVPQVFWQIAGVEHKNIQKELHDIISTLAPFILEKYVAGHDLLIRIPPLGLGSACWEVKPPASGWTPSQGGNSYASKTESEPVATALTNRSGDGLTDPPVG